MNRTQQTAVAAGVATIGAVLIARRVRAARPMTFDAPSVVIRTARSLTEHSSWLMADGHGRWGAPSAIAINHSH
jgi:hypothetical protein